MWEVILQANMTYHIESLYTSGKYDFIHCYTMRICHSTQWVNLVMCYCSDSKIFTEYKQENTSDFYILFLQRFISKHPFTTNVHSMVWNNNCKFSDLKGSEMAPGWSWDANPATWTQVRGSLFGGEMQISWPGSGFDVTWIEVKHKYRHLGGAEMGPGLGWGAHH